MKNGRFEVGDRVRILSTVPKSWWFKAGQYGVVSKVESWSTDYEVNVDSAKLYENPAYVNASHIALVTEKKRSPSIAKDLRLTPQARTVLKHLEHRGRISPSEALITYSISRLASCIHEVRRAGYNVLCIIKKDEHGHKYARYTLIKPSMVN